MDHYTTTFSTPGHLLSSSPMLLPVLHQDFNSSQEHRKAVAIIRGSKNGSLLFDVWMNRNMNGCMCEPSNLKNDYLNKYLKLLSSLVLCPISSFASHEFNFWLVKRKQKMKNKYWSVFLHLKSGWQRSDSSPSFIFFKTRLRLARFAGPPPSTLCVSSW